MMLFFALYVSAQTGTVKVIKAGRFIDVQQGKVLLNQFILIDHDTIKAVGSNITIPAGAKIIDLSNV